MIGDVGNYPYMPGKSLLCFIKFIQGVGIERWGWDRFEESVRKPKPPADFKFPSTTPGEIAKSWSPSR